MIIIAANSLPSPERLRRDGGGDGLDGEGGGEVAATPPSLRSALARRDTPPRGRAGGSRGASPPGCGSRSANKEVYRERSVHFSPPGGGGSDGGRSRSRSRSRSALKRASASHCCELVRGSLLCIISHDFNTGFIEWLPGGVVVLACEVLLPPCFCFAS